ncbi:fibronectin type III domain-containing protein, partial [bacterium]|nr:fibronectin type III domain-containing protein [bacterium]
MAPTAHVTNFATGSITTSSIPLTWTGASPQPDGYLILVSSTTVTDPVNGTAVANDTSLSDGVGAFNVTSGATTGYSGFTSFAAGTTYTFKIYPYNNSGTNIRYLTASAPSATGVLLPVAPSTPTFSSVTSSGFTVNWTAVTGAASYRLDIATDSGFTSFVSGYSDRTVSGISQAVTGLSANTLYYAQVRTVNSGGTSANSTSANTATLKNEPTAHVTGFATGTITTNSIPLSWTAASPQPDGYLIRVSSTTVTDPVDGTALTNDLSLSDGVAVFNVTSGATTSYSGFTGFLAGTSYTFKIYPYNNSGTGIDYLTTSAPSVTGVLLPVPPSAPTFSSVTASGFTVNWTAV